MASYFKIHELEIQLGDFGLGPLSLEMEKTDYLVLLGPTGCGKTTMIRCIIGALKTDRGAIFLGGKDIGALPPNRRKIGYVAQVSDLFPHMSVEENVSFGLRYVKLTPGERDSRLQEFLELLGIEKLRGHRASTLSGGESKKVAIARSLIVGPELLLLDEPLGMLDHNERKDMLDVLGRTHRELRTTTIHVTHDRHEAWGIARKCAVMDNGRIIETGSVAELFRTPRTRFVAEFLCGVNIFKADFEGTEAVTTWGRLALEKAPSFKSGYVMIRPEQVSLAGGGGESAVSGTVSAIRDFGEYVELEITVEDSSLLTVHSSVKDASGAKISQDVSLCWPESAVHCFEDREKAWAKE